MAIAIVYIGERRFHSTSQANHGELFDLIQSKHKIKIYDFTRSGPSTDGPFSSSGGIQVWDFLQAVKSVNEDIVIKLRTDLWFTRNSMSTVLSELNEIVNGNTDVAFMGVDFTNHYDKLHERNDATNKKVTDFAIIARRSSLDAEESIVTRLNGPKHKSGNVMFKYILAPDARAVSVSCQMYLLRKDYDAPSNWQIYSDWTSEYYKSEAAQQWVANNKKFIGKL